MIIKGTLTYIDFKKYYAYYALKNYLVRFLVMFIAFIMINSGFSLGKRLFPQNEILFTLILSLLMSSVIIVILMIIFFSKVKSMYEKNDRIKIENEYIITDDGINIKNDRGTYLMKWSDFTKAFEHKDMIFIYSTGNQAIILPLKYFQNKNDVDEFKNILKKNIQKTNFKQV